MEIYSRMLAMIYFKIDKSTLIRYSIFKISH